LFTSTTLAEMYRFVLLLTGDGRVAEQVIAETLHEAEAKLGEIRQETSRKAWLIQRIRQRCQRENVANDQSVPRLLRTPVEVGASREILPIEAFIVAQRFSTLPEPERSALALFYLDLLEVEEIGRLLKTSTEDLAVTLADARVLLREAMEATPA